jgi:hypothetical protein
LAQYFCPTALQPVRGRLGLVVGDAVVEDGAGQVVVDRFEVCKADFDGQAGGGGLVEAQAGGCLVDGLREVLGEPQAADDELGVAGDLHGSGGRTRQNTRKTTRGYIFLARVVGANTLGRNERENGGADGAHGR